MASECKVLVICGTIIHSTWSKPLEYFENYVLGVLEKKIIFFEPANKLENLKRDHGFSDSHIIYLNSREFLMPGLIDAHIHAPQIVFAGLYNGMPLDAWLVQHIMPMQKATTRKTVEERYKAVVERTLKNGTTSAAYLCTENVDATLYLCDVAEQKGQRAVVGLFAIDNPGYSDLTAEQVTKNIELYIQNVLSRKSSLVSPAVYIGTAMNASSELQNNIHHIQQKYNIIVLSHIRETASEFSCSEDGDGQTKEESPAKIFDKHGLLTDKIIFGHGIYLNDDELIMLKASGSSIAHCPNSNMSLLSGLCDIRRLLDSGITLALGTDISGGYNPSIFDAVLYAVQTSNVISFSKSPDYKRLNFKHAFQLATLGGSKALGLEKVIGNFEIGKEFDALIIDSSAGGNIDLFPEDNVENMIEKFFFLGDDRNIKSVYIAGKKVL